MKILQEHLNKWLLFYVLLAMSTGLVIGYPSADWTKANQNTVSNLTTLAVFLIVYPMMINLKIEALLQASKNVKGLTLAVLYNFVWAPLIGWMFVRFFVSDPTLALGFLLVMVVPCSSMSIGYTGLSDGNVELATVVVALSFILAVIAVPVWMAIFAANYQVPLPLQDMLLTILTVLIAPMILGYLTRMALVRRWGEKRFKQLQPFFPSLSLLAMFGIVFLIFFGKAATIVDKWQTVLPLVVPATLFFVVTLIVITWINRRLGLSYRNHMAVVFASTGKNNGTAIAIATMAFTPLAAVPAAIMPIFQIIFLVLYLKMANWLRGYFGEPHAGIAVTSATWGKG